MVLGEADPDARTKEGNRGPDQSHTSLQDEQRDDHRLHAPCEVGPNRRPEIGTGEHFQPVSPRGVAGR